MKTVKGGDRARALLNAMKQANRRGDGRYQVSAAAEATGLQPCQVRQIIGAAIPALKIKEAEDDTV